MLGRMPDARIIELSRLIDPHDAIAGLIGRALVDDPPLGAKEGGVIRPGYDAELDDLRAGASEGGVSGFVSQALEKALATA